MLEKFVLPKRRAVVAGEGAARSKFESLYEVEEIAGRRTTFDQKMQVIWHETVGVGGEIASCDGIAEEFERGVGDGMIREAGTTAVTAEGYENGGLAGIVLWFEADDFAGVH